MDSGYTGKLGEAQTKHSAVIAKDSEISRKQIKDTLLSSNQSLEFRGRSLQLENEEVEYLKNKRQKIEFSEPSTLNRKVEKRLNRLLYGSSVNVEEEVIKKLLKFNASPEVLRFVNEYCLGESDIESAMKRFHPRIIEKQ